MGPSSGPRENGREGSPDEVDHPVLVVGLDGADRRYLDAFADSMPTVAGLRADGVDAALASTHPPWTGSAWPSLYTGVDPSRHGVYDFFDYRDSYPDEADVVSRADVQAPAIWNYLSAVGHRVVVVNVPVTHPADPVDGVVVPGYLAPEDDPGHPPGVRDRLADALGRPYRVYSEHETAAPSGEKIDGYESLIRQRATAAAHLLATERWDFAMVQVQKTDSVFHNSDDPADHRRIYAAADDLVAELVDACDREPNVVVCSDHGMGPVTGYDVYVNELLARRGLLESTSTTTDRSLVGVKRPEEADDSPSPAGDAVERLAALGRRVGVGPATVYRHLRRVGLAERLRTALPSTVKQSLARGVDWRASQAYCRRGSEQGIRVNLAGRDPEGVVAPAEYEAVRDEIIRVLEDATAPDGAPLFEFVSRREAVYDGPHADAAPDVLFRTTEMNHVAVTELTGETTVPTDDYSHKRTGAFVAAGPDVGEWAGDELSLLDVAPVVFALLGTPVPERLCNAVPEGLTAASPPRRDYGDVPYGHGGSHAGDDGADYSQDRDVVERRLRDLGYR